jgi:hypothetical protein
MGITNLITRKPKNTNGRNDAKILQSYVEYSQDNKTLNYMVYRMEILDANTNEVYEVYKAIKLLRIIRLPKSAKQLNSFMDMHAQWLAGVWENKINFITMIANMIEPVPVGLVFMYGCQGVSSDLESAKQKADHDFAAMVGMLQGTYRTLEFRTINYDEVEWLREKMFNMNYMTCLRGLPKPKAGGVDAGTKGIGGANVNADAQDTTEEFIAGMSDREYIVQILTTPVSADSLQDWLGKTAREMTKWQSQMQGTKGMSAGLSLPMMYMANLGASDGWSHSYTDSEGTSHGISHTEGTSVSDSVSHSNSFSEGNSHSANVGLSQNVSEGVTTGHSYGISEGMSVSHTDSESASVSRGHSEGTSYGYNEGESASQSHSIGTSQSTSISESHGSSQSVSESDSASQSHSVGAGTSQSVGDSQGYNVSDSTGKSGSASASYGESSSVSGGLSAVVGMNMGGGDNSGVSLGSGESTSHSDGVSSGRSSSSGASQNESFGNSSSQSLGKSSGVSDGVSVSKSFGTSESWGESFGQSRGQSVGASASDSVSTSRGVSSSDGWSKNIGQSESISMGQSQSKGAGISQGESVGSSATKSVGTSVGHTVGKSVSDGTTDTTSRSMGTAQGLTGAISQGTSATMGMGPSLSYTKQFQWIDQEVANIVKLLEFQNNRIMTALNGGGAFYTDVYIATMDEAGCKTAQSLAKSTWYGEGNLVCPLQVMELEEDEREHLLYHFNAFSADASKEGIPGELESYKYSTILLPAELTAYSHLPRISEGGLYADVNDIPKFAVPSMRKGEIYMGNVLSAERWTMKNGYRTPFEYRLEESELMHGFFTGESRSGKTVAATRFIAEIACKVKRETGKRLRIVCMDPKQDWRILAHFVEPERFHFYSLGNPEFLPISLNVCKIPHNVFPQQWIDGLIELFCRAYGLGERGKSVLAETFYELYENAGVFVENWREVAPKRSQKVTFPAIYKRMAQIKLDLEDPTNKKGKSGNDVRDAYARVLDRLQVFGREFSIESRLFGQETGMGIDELIGADDVVVLESYGLESTFKNFIFGTITSGFFKWAQGHEGGFKSKDQYETILVIEEANEVLVGQDSADKSGGSPLSGQSEFEKILDQSAGLGLFIISITQKIAAMPSSVIANSGLVFAGKISREEDVKIVIRKIGREERYEDRDLAKWFPRSPIGWFVCRSGRNFDFKEMEPVLVDIARLNVDPPTNTDLEYLVSRAQAKRIQNKI